jgi:glycosyltransferase involved in cell wall biosynthesis
VTAAPTRTLFIGRGRSSAVWYRCALPAMVLGADWVGANGAPPDGRFQTGRVPRDFTWEQVPSYKIVVLQAASGIGWLHTVRSWQQAGVTVLYEIDDWLRGVRRQRGHENREHFNRRAVEEFELVMRVADGVICSTPWLAERYAAINPRTVVCPNGIDLKRYQLERPAPQGVTVGWAGGTGHHDAVEPWLPYVADIMRARADVRFHSVGQPFAAQLEPEFGERTLSLPFGSLEAYPAAMADFDVALAPAADTGFFRGKSDLRWLEAAAMGVPTIADPAVYPEIEHGVTGFHAETGEEMRDILAQLVDDQALRQRVGEAARAYVAEHRRIEIAAGRWAEVLGELAPRALEEVA